MARSVLLRVAALGPDASAVARAVALLGDRASLVAIAELACLPAQRAADAADSLVDAEVLTTSGPGAGLAVAHPLVRAVLEQDIPALERAGARLRAARLLHAAGAPVERVAAHLSEAAATGEPWVVEVLRRAALMAVAQGAPVAAARWLARALEEPPAAEHRHAVLRELALAEAAAALPEADARLQTVAADTPDPREAAAIALARGRLLHALGRAGNAATCLREGLEVVGDDPELRSQLLAALLSVGVFHAGLRADAIATVDAAMGEAPAGDTPAERRLLATMALRLAQEAAPQTQTLALARRAWAGGRLLADSSAEQAWVPLCWAHQLADTPAEGRLVAEAAQEAARERGSPLEYATASYCRGAALTLQGCPVEAEAEMERALAAQEDGWAAALRQAHAAIAMARAERGDLAAAEAALAAAGPEGEMPALERVYCAEARGRVLAYRGRLPEALAALQDCGAGLAELQARATASAWRPRAAVIANHLGDRTLAEELLAAEQEMVEAIGAPGLQSRLLRARGLITGGEEGIALLHAAVDVLASVDHHAERAPALADLGAALRRANQRAAAREPLRAALALAVGNGATLLADRVRTELAATGARPRREQTSGLDALTPSERRVARMAGEGLTNREIAHALFVTPKAVEFHLRNVYLKLGIENRRGLAEALAAPAV